MSCVLEAFAHMPFPFADFVLDCSISEYKTGSQLQHMGSSSLTGDRTWAPCTGSSESQPLDHQGIPWDVFLWQRKRAGDRQSHAAPLKAFAELHTVTCTCILLAQRSHPVNPGHGMEKFILTTGCLTSHVVMGRDEKSLQERTKQLGVIIIVYHILGFWS